MEQLIKNIEKKQAYDIKELVEYEKGQISSLTLAETEGTGVTVFAMDKGEALSTHAASGDALVYVIDGEALITISDIPETVKEGNFIVMPKGEPHSVKALTRMKMMLTVVKPTR